MCFCNHFRNKSVPNMEKHSVHSCKFTNNECETNNIPSKNSAKKCADGEKGKQTVTFQNRIELGIVGLLSLF